MFDEIIEDFQKFKTDLPHFINGAINEKEQQVVELNRDQLYYDGIDAYENPLWPEYRPYTIEMKEIRNSIPGHIYEPTDHVALIQDGGFYAGMYIIYRPNEIVIWSKDPKVGKLVRKYGREIFGIAEKNMPKFYNLVLPVLERLISRRLEAYETNR